MTGSFLFVKASDRTWKPDSEHYYYGNSSPSYAHDLLSWEWLTERLLRRLIFPLSLQVKNVVGENGRPDTNNALEKTAAEEDAFRVDRRKPTASYSPLHYTSPTGGSFAIEKPRWGSSPSHAVLGMSSVGVPTVLTVSDLIKATHELIFQHDWLYPGWSKNDLSEWSLSGSTQLSTSYIHGSYSGSWRYTRSNTSFEFPKDFPFKCLDFMRTDYGTKTVPLYTSAHGTINVTIPYTPVYYPRTTEYGGSVQEIDGQQIRTAREAAANHGDIYEKFYIEYNKDIPSGSVDNAPYPYPSSTDNIGWLSSLFSVKNTAVVLSGSSGNTCHLVPDVKWGDHPTWWHQNGFPKGLDYTISPILKDQLTALCSTMQPAVPPSIPTMFRNGMPESSTSPEQVTGGSSLPGWLEHLSLAATPFDISKRLDAMTRTVHQVNFVYARYKSSASSEVDLSLMWDTTVTNINTTESAVNERTIVTHVGARLGIIDEDNLPFSTSMQASGKDSLVRNTYWVPSTGGAKELYEKRREKYSRKHTREFTANCEYLVCLRGTRERELDARDLTILKTSTTTKSEVKYNDDKGSTTTTTTEGAEPASYNPNHVTLLFPDWMLPWIKSAELFAYIKSTLDLPPHTPAYHINRRGDKKGVSGNGSVTVQENRKIVSLGTMDTNTGRFRKVNVNNILTEVDPSPTAYVETSLPTMEGGNFVDLVYVSIENIGNGIGWSSATCERSITRSEYQEDNGSWNVITVDSRGTEAVKGNAAYSRRREISYFVVVEWNFDRDDPETLQNYVSILSPLYRSLQDVRILLDEKSDELAATTRSRDAILLQKEATTAALANLGNSEQAAAVLRQEAESALMQAQTNLSTQQGLLDAAIAAVDTASDTLDDARATVAEKQAAYDSAVAEGTGVEAAAAALASAQEALTAAEVAYDSAVKQSHDLEDTVDAAQDSVDQAQAHYDRVFNNASEVLEEEYNKLQATSAFLTAQLDEYNRKIETLTAEVAALTIQVNDIQGQIDQIKNDEQN